jgi:hypothetical protein
VCGRLTSAKKEDIGLMMLPSEQQTLPLLGAALVFIAGLLLGGVVNAAVQRYAAFKESKAVALALRAEIQALLRLATYRDYVALTDAMIVRLRDLSHVLNASDFALIRITQDYFSVFHALSPKIGLLGPLGENVVLAYSATKALFEDFATLYEEGRPYLEGTKTAAAEEIRAYLLEVSTRINQLLRVVVNRGTNTRDALGAYANRRWLRVFK